LTHSTQDKALFRFAHTLADEGGALLCSSFRKDTPYEKKDDGSLVTHVDKIVEKKIRERIRLAHPHHGIIGEEYPDENPDAEWVWCIDPLDGTTAFLAGSPLFGLLIGLAYRGKPLYGIIDHPAQSERWCGGGNEPTSCAMPMPCVPRHTKTINRALMHATTPHMFQPQHKPYIDALQKTCLAIRYGLDCYAYGLLVSGFIDIIAEATMKIGDYMALAPVVQASGATISDWHGKALNIKSDGTVLACCHQELHERVLTLWHGKA